MNGKMTGLKSIPFDVIAPENISLLEVEYGNNGFAVVWKLMQMIGTRGYYSNWNTDVKLLFIKLYCPQISCNLVSEILNCALRRNIFDKEKFEKYHILTNAKIQECYLIANERRQELFLEKKYLLNSAYNRIKSANKSNGIVYKLLDNDNIIEEIKVNKNKEKEMKNNFLNKEKEMKNNFLVGKLSLITNDSLKEAIKKWIDNNSSLFKDENYISTFFDRIDKELQKRKAEDIVKIIEECLFRKYKSIIFTINDSIKKDNAPNVDPKKQFEQREYTKEEMNRAVVTLEDRAYSESDLNED